METNEDILKIVSNETIDATHNISIVTPSIYKSMFAKNASVHGADLDDEEKITDTLLDNKINMCNVVQEQNSDNVLKLSAHTDKAIIAIKEKDTNTLVEVLKETNALKQEIEKLKEAVYKDELTNVYNRKWLNDNYLDIDTDVFNKNGTLAIIDLNYFKIVNDTHGHIIGDKVLVFIANQLKITKGHVIRYGGDEFIILFSNSKQDTAITKLNALRDNIISKKLKAGDHSFRVSFSIGAHEFKQGDSLNETIELADKDMYNDKIKIKEKITGID